MTNTALEELTSVARRGDMWWALAIADTKSRYRRTSIGPYWITISMGAMVGSVGILYAGLFQNEVSQYLPFLAAGSVVWAFISSVILEGCGVFIAAAGYIKSVPLPLSVHIYRLIARSLIVLAHNALLLIVVWLIFRWPIGPEILLAPIGLAIDCIALFGMVLLLGVLCARFRDIPQIMAAAMQLLFLLTPIVWMPTALKGTALKHVIEWNPAYYLLEIVRGPLLGQAPPLWIWVAAVMIAVGFLAAGIAFYEKFRTRVSYWL